MADASSIQRDLIRARWQILQAVLDLSAWAGAYAVAGAGVGAHQLGATRLAVAIGGTCVVHFAAAYVFPLYRRRFQFGSFDEAVELSRGWLVTTMVLVAFAPLVLDGNVQGRVAVSLAVACAALVVMCATRMTRRITREWSARHKGVREPVIVFGAGSGGCQAVRAMCFEPGSPYRPVALLDDDPDKRSLRVAGVPVVGDRGDIAAAAARFGAKRLVVAVPSANGQLLRDLDTVANRAGLHMQVLPSVHDLVSGRVRVQDIHDVNLDDLLGRHAIDIDSSAVAEFLRGKRVLVTGAGGSIGSELCRVITEYAPDKLFMLDRDESALHALQLSITGRALLDSDDLVLADIRDGAAIRDIFMRLRPHIVFHAAALKHLPMLERYPAEAVKTNVEGTLRVLEAAAQADVPHVVNVSTDKAADPHSVLGYSKRIAERLTATAAATTGQNYVSVRFGNVLGSRGSVLTSFTAQAQAGGPMTVTHPDVTRYFMSVREAVQLTLQASVVSESGDVLVLDMGDPIRIVEVARRVAMTTVGEELEIHYTGLRPGEKLHEVLLGTGERDVRPHHALITQAPVPQLAVSALDQLAGLEGTELVSAMKDLCSLNAVTRDFTLVSENRPTAGDRATSRGPGEPTTVLTRLRVATGTS